MLISVVIDAMTLSIVPIGSSIKFYIASSTCTIIVYDISPSCSFCSKHEPIAVVYISGHQETWCLEQYT